MYEYSQQPASTPFILISFTHLTNTNSKKKYIQLARRFARTAIVPRLVESLRIFGFSKEAGDEEENQIVIYADPILKTNKDNKISPADYLLPMSFFRCDSISL